MVLKKIIKKNHRARSAELTLEWREMIQKNIFVDTCKREWVMDSTLLKRETLTHVSPEKGKTKIR